MNRENAPEPTFDALYRDIVLDHYREPHGRAALPVVSARAEGMNPLCGDEVDLEISVGADGKIDGVRVDGRGCAISVSSGSILHDLVVGADAEGARRILGAVKTVLHGGAMPAEPDLGDFEALEGVKKFPVRVKCALLPWTTLDEALRDLDARRKA